MHKFSSNENKEKVDTNRKYEKKQEEIYICKPRLSIFHLEWEDFFCTMRAFGSFSTKKRKHCQIHEQKKATSNNQSIKTMFVIK